MEPVPSSARSYCLTIAFVAALLTFSFTSKGVGDKYDLMLFFLWATFIPWFICVVILPVTKREPRN